MTNRSKKGNQPHLHTGASLWLTLVYGLFTLLYTVYIADHPVSFGHMKGDNWWYFLQFLLIDGYFFFILQRLVLKTGNWGILLLMPPVILIAMIIAGYLLVFVLRFGGGTLLDHDKADMILGCLLFLGFSYYTLGWVVMGKKSGRR